MRLRTLKPVRRKPSHLGMISLSAAVWLILDEPPPPLLGIESVIDGAETANALDQGTQCEPTANVHIFSSDSRCRIPQRKLQETCAICRP